MIILASRSKKYCGDVELPVPRKKNGVVSFDFPFTPLARRIYNEEEDKEMDIWINIDTASQHLEDVGPKTLTLVVTPFKVSRPPSQILNILYKTFPLLLCHLSLPLSELYYLHFILFNFYWNC